MDATPNLVTCEWCNCPVGKKKIEKHKTLSCPKAPAEIIANRPKRPDKKSNYHSWLRAIEERITGRPQNSASRFHFEVDPNPDRLSTTPSPQDRQINPEATVIRIEDGVFHVHRVLSSGGLWDHPLQVECGYCHRTIKVNARGPSDMQKFAKDEA